MSDINQISNRTIFRILAMTAGFILLILVARLVRRELLWVATAFFLAVALNPLVHKLTSKMPGRRRGLAIGLVFLLLLVSLAGIFYLLIPALASQTQSLVKQIPHYVTQFENSNSLLGSMLAQYDLSGKLKAYEASFSQHLLASSGGILKATFSSLAATLTIIVFTVFMLIEGPAWGKRFWAYQPIEGREHRQALANQMYQAVAGYVTGNLVISLITATVAIIAMFAVGVPYAIPMGLLLGLLRLIPIVGGIAGSLIIILVSLFNSAASAVIMTVFLVIYFQVENHVLAPVILGKRVALSPLTVLLAAIMGVALGGLIGALLAIPVAAVIQILVLDYLKSHAKYAR